MNAVVVFGFEDHPSTVVLIGCEGMATTFALAAQRHGLSVKLGQWIGEDERSDTEKERAEWLVRTIMVAASN